MEKLASITILSTNRQKVARELNELFTNNGHLIMSRMGVNVQQKCLEHCPGMIILAIKAEQEKINKFIEDLKEIQEIEIQFCIFN